MSSYTSAIHKTLKKKYKGVTIAKQALDTVEAILLDLENQLVTRSLDVAGLDNKKTLSAKHVQVAVKILLPSELGGYAMANASKLTTDYIEGKSGEDEEGEEGEESEESEEESEESEEDEK